MQKLAMGGGYEIAVIGLTYILPKLETLLHFQIETDLTYPGFLFNNIFTLFIFILFYFYAFLYSKLRLIMISAHHISCVSYSSAITFKHSPFFLQKFLCQSWHLAKIHHLSEIWIQPASDKTICSARSFYLLCLIISTCLQK